MRYMNLVYSSKKANDVIHLKDHQKGAAVLKVKDIHDRLGVSKPTVTKLISVVRISRTQDVGRGENIVSDGSMLHLILSPLGART